MERGAILETIQRAFHNDDAATVKQLLAEHSELKGLINEPIPECFDSPPVLMARSRAMLDVLLDAGADINAKSRWWAGGFAFVHTATPELAKYAVERGASLDIHAAARLGMLDRVRELVHARPDVVHERGGDGQTPLHFASTRQIAEFLLDHGAEIDARDVDHESTPAQYMLDDRQEIARFLIQRGCSTDIFMAAALGDLELARKHLAQDPECMRMRVSDEWFPMIGGKSGGTIYQWKLGWHVSPHQVAKKFGHEELFRFLMEQSPAEVKLLNAAWLGDEETATKIAGDSNVRKSFRPADLRQVAHAARNNELTVVRLLLKAGLPVNSRGQHNATPLHWAAWHGNAEMVRLILQHSPDLEDSDNEFSGTPFRWAIHGSENGWYRDKGSYAETVELLLRAGARPAEKASGSANVREALKRHGLPE